MKKPFSIVNEMERLCFNEADSLPTRSVESDTQLTDLSENVKSLWREFTNMLASFAAKIVYKELVELASLRDPPAQVMVVLGFFEALFGLEGSLSAARQTFFKEISAFLRFLCEVRLC